MNTDKTRKTPYLRYFAFVMVTGVAGLCLYASSLPDHFHFERSIVIQAPAGRIFPYVNNFKRSMEWSPWEAIDPAMERKFSGPESGEGAIYAWSGNSDAGAGDLKITQSIPNSKVVVQFHMARPMEGNNQIEYTLNETPEGTRVTWSMDGEQPYVGKLMSIVMDCEKIMDEQFNKGLANLKRITEKG